MSKRHCFGIINVLAAVILAAGCKPKAPPPTPTAHLYFHTAFQSESQFIIEAIASDLAEQMFYAAKLRLPDRKYFSVAATERRGSPRDAPVYDLQIQLDQKLAPLKLDLPVNGPIWSAEVYHDLTVALARSVGLRAPGTDKNGGTALLSNLLDGTAQTIEEENQILSDALEKNFANPQLHEQAALLLGAFLLRDHSGFFFEIRSPLSRLTAHLAMARFLNGTNSLGLDGQLAAALLLTLVNDQALALERLKSLPGNNTAVAGLVRALQARNTGDFRPLSEVAGRSPVENVAWFIAMADYATTSGAWSKLDDGQKQIIDIVRAANETGYSVEMGHELLQTSLPLELEEIRSMYALSHDKEMSQTGLVEALNELPDGCFRPGHHGETRVRIIGWGQWAFFLQRHLCHAVQQNFTFLNWKLGVPEEAKKFAAQCDTDFAGLRLYPFVRRFDCTDVEAYHKSVDDGFKVTVATPHLVPAECWNYICYTVPFAPLYAPNPNPHINEWHRHNPPPGTVYDLQPRLNHPSLIDRGDVLARFDQLHQLAPYDVRIARFILERKYKKHPTYDQAIGLYQPLLPWSVSALRDVADTVRDQPDRYESLLLQAAKLDPAVYYSLGGFFAHTNTEDKAAQYIDEACRLDPDGVRISNEAEWRVRYYLKKGDTAKAREIADFAGEVYSYGGLVAKAVFMESTTNYQGAFEWFAKIEERYNDSWPLICFCERYIGSTNDKRFDGELKNREKILFPKGIEKVSLADFHAAPTDGVLIQDQGDLLLAAHMHKGEVIVALNGIRTHNNAQYIYLREFLDTPEVDLIVWQGDAFHEIKSSPPNHRFGVRIGDYVTNQPAAGAR